MESSLVVRLAAGLPERIARRIELLLASVPDPETVQRYLERLLQEAPSAFDRITTSPAALRCAVNIFSYSRFLSDAVLKKPERILEVSNSGSFYRALSVEGYEERLFDFLGKERRDMPSALDLARFRRRQLLRISLRDVMGVSTLAEVTEELSNLADATLDFTYRRIRARLVAQYGEPRLADGGVCGFSVISLGKLGGKELNYSSDIDLMFVYGGNGETDGPATITNKEFCKKIANEYTALLSTYTADGQCYRVDLRLRPDGTLGEICISDEGARRYYVDRARDWEKQMLIKARLSAGEPEPGAGLLEFVEPLIYQSSLDFRAVEAVSETRQRIGEKVAAKKRARRGLDIKLTPGGIRDIEFLVQCLQRLHGGREPWVRHGGTMFALFRLRDKRLLSDNEYARLAAAYQFLRYVEHRLQLDEDQQTHALPTDDKDLDLLARKMPPESNGDARDGAWFKQRLSEHLAAVLEIYDRVIHAQKPLYYSPVAVPELVEEVETSASVSAPVSNLTRLLDQRAPALAAVVAGAGLNRGRERFDLFLEKAFANPAVLDRLDADSNLAASVLDIFEHSPHFADDLLRQPELLDDIGAPPLEASEPLDEGGALRRFYRRQMLRIQSEHPHRSSHLRHAAQDVGPRRPRDRCFLPHRCHGFAAAREPRLHPARSDDGDLSGAAWHERIRPRVRRRSGLRSARRGRRRVGILDQRGRAHDPDHELLHWRRGNVHGGHAAAS